MAQTSYLQGIEESIRRCEELLALTPLAFTFTDTKSNPASRGFSGVKQAMDVAGNDPADERLRKKNMDLLTSFDEETIEKQKEIASGSSQGLHSVPSSKMEFEIQANYCARGRALEEKCDMPKDGMSSFSDFKSPVNRSSDRPSDWRCSANQLGQESVHLSIDNLQSIAANYSEDEYIGSNPDTKAMRDHELKESFSVSCCRPDECTDGSSPDTTIDNQQIRDRRNIETICSLHEIGRSGEASPDSDLKFSDSREMCASSGQDESTIAFVQTKVPEGSQDAIDSKWEGVVEISEARPWSNSEHRNSPSCIEQKHKMFRKERSKTTPRQRHQEEILQSYQRSKSVSKEERVQDGCRATFYTKIFSDIAALAVAPRNDTPNKDRIASLSKPRTEVYKKLAELKALFEEEQLQECSFKPAIGRKPDPESAYSTPIFERISKIQQKIENRKRARKVCEKEELDNCSFRPRINWHSQFLDKLTYQPIERRFQELQRQKIEKLANAQLCKDLGLTFKPEINQKSMQLLKQKGLEMTNVADRLTTLKTSFHQDCKHEKKKNTFTPEINRNTEYIMASSKQFGGHHVGFLQRQEQYLQAVEEKKRLKEQEVPVELTFQPNIGNSAIILKQSPTHDVYDETDFERFERLAYKDRERLWQAREKVAKNYYAQFKFQPELDEFSRILAGQASSRDLYRDQKAQKVKEALEQVAEKEFQQKCPFRPEVNAYKCSSANTSSLVYQRRQERKEKANSELETKTLKELQELKECTFKPSLNPSMPRPQTPTLIKGFERHLELQMIAKQMKKEQEELERKVFFSHAYTTPTRQYTIPKPFMLQTIHCGARHMRRSVSSQREADVSSGSIVSSSCHYEGIVRPFSSVRSDESSGFTMSSSCCSMKV